MRVKGVAISIDQLLDAAEAVVLRDGIGKLTLDAVAEAASVSKGGLTYHFTSKEKLVEALVVRIVATHRRDQDEAIAAAPPGPGRVLRALLSMCLNKPADWKENVRRTSMVLMAAMVSNPELVQPLRDLYADVHARLKDDRLAPGYGEVVLAALDGMWFSWIFGIQDLTEERMAQFRLRLDELVQRGIDVGAGAAEASTPACKQTVFPAAAH